MPKLQVFLRLLCVWAMLIVSSIASAHSPVHPETRVGDFEVAAETCIRLSVLATSSGHQENVDASTAEAVGYPHATKGGLPRSGAIPKSLSAMSRAESLARKLKMNVNSPTTRQVLNSLDDSVGSFVGQFRKGSINRELPGEVMDMTVEQALKHSTKVRKLLTDGRFVK